MLALGLADRWTLSCLFGVGGFLDHFLTETGVFLTHLSWLAAGTIFHVLLFGAGGLPGFAGTFELAWNEIGFLSYPSCQVKVTRFVSFSQKLAGPTNPRPMLSSYG